jgi:hypothetical protein
MSDYPQKFTAQTASDKKNRSQPLRLDFITRPNLASNILNGLVLVSALSLSGYLLHWYSTLRVEHDMRQTKPARKNINRTAPMSGAAQTNAQLVAEVTHANKIVQQLTLPWGQLFDALEAATYQPAPLLQVHPDSENRVLTLVGETQDFIELDVYLKQLKNQPIFTSVYLVDYELFQADIPRPLHFTLRATW